jgi:glycosyltransferase involved in cell wall biosynthesis
MLGEYEVTVLTGRHKPSLPITEKVNGVNVVRANPLFFLHKGYISIDLIWKYRRLARLADLVHLHVPLLEAGLLALLTPKSIPIVSTYHCDVVAGKDWLDRLAIMAVRSSSKLCLKRSGKVVVTSRDYAAGSPILRGLEDRWVEIFPPCKEIAYQTSINGLANDGAVRIGFLGRFVREKGVDVLLDAVPLVIEKLPNAKFLLAGESIEVAGGTIYREIKPKLDLVGSNVEVLGRLENSELQAFYNSLDLFVLPGVNSYEAFGMVQVEAMRAGVQVVATDMRGVRIPVQLTGNGELVPPGDPVALAASIIRCLSKADRYRRIEIAQRADKIFANSRIFDQHDTLYRSLL